MRKVHRYGLLGPPTAVTAPRSSSTKTLCGLWYYGGIVLAVSDAAFVNLPEAVQCTKCRGLVGSAIRPNAFGLPSLPADADVVWEGGVSSMETMFLAWARLLEDAANLRRDPEWRHRCYHRTFDAAGYVSLEPCGGCGRVSLLDPALGERAIAAAIGPSIDGYVFRHACDTCGIAFRSKYPRGMRVRCAFCRGKPEDAVQHRETYTSAFAVST